MLPGTLLAASSYSDLSSVSVVMPAARLRAISEEVLRSVRAFLPPEVQLLDTVMGVPSRCSLDACDVQFEIVASSRGFASRLALPNHAAGKPGITVMGVPSRCRFPPTRPFSDTGNVWRFCSMPFQL